MPLRNRWVIETMKRLFYIWIFVLFVLHFDFWFADSTDLALGFIPAGLFYQMIFTVAAAITWYIAGKYFWPDYLKKADTSGKEQK